RGITEREVASNAHRRVATAGILGVGSRILRAGSRLAAVVSTAQQVLGLPWREGDAPATVGRGQSCQGYAVVVLAPGGWVADEDVRAMVAWVGASAGDDEVAAFAAVFGELLGDGDDERGPLEPDGEFLGGD